MTPDCAAGAQGRRETCDLTAKYRRSATGLAQGVVPLDPGLRAAGAQGRRETCELTAKYRRSATGLAARWFGVFSLSVE